MKEEKEKLPVDETKKSGEVTRRDFLVGAGTVVVGGAIGAGLLSSCSGETVTTTVKETITKTVPTTVTAAATTITDTVTTTVGAGATVTATATKTVTQPGGGGVWPADEPEETTLKVGCSDGRALSAVDTKHGKIVRIRPHHWDWKYTVDELKPGKLEARGKTFNFTMKSLQSHYFACYKKRVYSPNRIMYPLKRVDWEPGGGDPSNYNPQNRAKSKFKRVSWDYALNTVVSEIQRMNTQYTPWAILTCQDIHGETKQIHGGFNGHGCGDRLLRQNFGGYTQQMRDPD
ncbi:MAG: molybdopterin-dependent oxidoreductase, partial [Sedimentisphaerales bacterium]|nr:molybdopterin-dependent oxidoreductase [Sedimentisphaerales bacterium]